MLKIRDFVAFGCLGLITGCGGGGGNGGEVGTFPPPPTAQTNSTLTDLRYSESFRGEASEISYRLSRTTGAATLRGQAASVSTDGGTVRYDASSQSYTLSGTPMVSSVTFGPADKDAAESTDSFTIYQKVSGNRQEAFGLFTPGAGNSKLALTYTSYAAYQRINDGADLDIDTAFFAFGVRTTTSQMPRSGTASYTTLIDGQFGDPSGVYALGGESSFVADFSAATFAFSMEPIGQNVVSGQLKSFGQHDIAGQIYSNAEIGQTFRGSGRDGDYSSSVNGFFYGPAAAEIGGTFTLTGNDGFGIGAVVGKKN